MSLTPVYPNLSDSVWLLVVVVLVMTLVSFPIGITAIIVAVIVIIVPVVGRLMRERTLAD